MISLLVVWLALAQPALAGGGNDPASGESAPLPNEEEDSTLNEDQTQNSRTLDPKKIQLAAAAIRTEFESAVREGRPPDIAKVKGDFVKQAGDVRGLNFAAAMKAQIRANDQLNAGAGGAGGAALRPDAPAYMRAVLNAGKEFAPNDPYYESASGREYLRRQQYREAFKDLGSAIEHGMRDAPTFAAYGAAAHHLGDMDLASQSSALALKMDPENIQAHSVFKLSEGRPSAMSLPSVLRDSQISAAQGAPASNALGSLQAASPEAQAAGVGSMDAAQRAAEAALQARQPASKISQSAALTRDAASALGVRDYTSAYEIATKAIDLNASNAQAWNYRAIADNKLERYNDAVYDASFALSLAPKNAPALQSRAWALNKQKRYKEALIDTSSILEQDPNNAFAYQNRAFALAGLGDREEMTAALKRSAELDARFAERYEKALQVPQDADALFLFDEAPAAKPEPGAASPAQQKKRFLKLTLNAVGGGVLVALALLHLFSPTWREKVNGTIRRVIGASGGEGAAAEGAATASFWGQYELLREVGLGGMGVVYEAKDRGLDRVVAIKKMRDEIRLDPRERARFMEEAKTVAALHHPNIVDIYSVIEDGSDVYLVFEFVKGRTVADLLREKGSLPFEAARRILKNACDAVEYAHRHRVIHRDIKPSNIMVTEEGTAKVMDFGVARQAKDAATKLAMTNTVVGTPPYMAPEQEQGTVRPESDVYALAIVFYECLAGQLPFAGQGAGMLLNKINARFTPVSQAIKDSLPSGLDAVLAKALAPDPDRRYRTAADFIAAVDVLGGAASV